MIEIRLMSAPELSSYREAGAEHLALEQASAYSRPIDDMRIAAAKAFEPLESESVAKAGGHHLYTILSDGRPIGQIWLALRGYGGQAAYVLDFHVSSAFRGRGHGKEAFAALEREARDMGARWISLSVFAHNSRAAEFYDLLGFRVVSHTLAKNL